MNRLRKAVAAVALLPAAAATTALGAVVDDGLPGVADTTLTLTGTIRDFEGVNATTDTALSTHPDFDQFDFGPLLDLQAVIEGGGIPTPAQITAAKAGVPGEYLPLIPIFNPEGQDQTTKVEPGIVGNTITPGGKPGYVGGTDASLHKSTSTAENFNQWFNDVPGVNQSQSINLVLKDLGGGNFQFQSDRTVDPGTGVGDDGDADGGFFPIDGALAGNDGADLGGTPHNYSFTLEIHDTITYKAGTGQIFSFTGDDDLWVFINGNLAVDVGGVHNELIAGVNLDNAAAALGLVDGQAAAFDLFYAERNQFHSDLFFQTNFFSTAVIEPPPDGEVIPLPAAAWMGLSTLAGMGGVAGLRKRFRRA